MISGIDITVTAVSITGALRNMAAPWSGALRCLYRIVYGTLAVLNCTWILLDQWKWLYIASFYCAERYHSIPVETGLSIKRRERMLMDDVVDSMGETQHWQ